MKFSSFRYLVKEGIKNTWTNRLMTIASVGVLVACMVIIGLAVMISENINMAMGNLEQQNVVMAYMKDRPWALYLENSDGKTPNEAEYVIKDQEDIDNLIGKIKGLDNVEKVEFVSSEEGLKQTTEDMLEGQEQFFNFLNEEDGNPMPSAAKVTMKDMEKFDKTVEKIENLEGVAVVRSNSDLAGKLSAIENGIAVAGIWIIAILMIISLVIVSNTIRVTMYTRKLEISIMKAVGATDTFVRLPFVVEGMVIGIVSALFAEGILYCCYRIATETIVKTFGGVIPFDDMWLALLILFLGIGIISGVIGSLIMISKYLRKEGSEFAAI